MPKHGPIGGESWRAAIVTGYDSTAVTPNADGSVMERLEELRNVVMLAGYGSLSMSPSVSPSVSPSASPSRSPSESPSMSPSGG